MQIKSTVFFLSLLMLSITTALAQPNSNFTANTTTGCSNLSTVVNFQDLSTGNPVSWLWDFGAGGATSTLQNPTFVYSAAGCYDITLTVTDAGGLTNTLTQTCFVEVFQAPIPDFTVDVNTGCAPFTACFTDNSTLSSAGASFQWTLSDGSAGTGTNPCFTFTTAPDTVGLVLTVTDANGCTGFAQFNDVIEVIEAPILDFTVDVNSSCNPPLTINVTNNSIINGATNPTYTWIFPGGVGTGGGSTATGQTPGPITYNSDGQYDITLQLSTPEGCLDTLVQTGVVGIGGVTAGFTADNTVICLGETVNFTNLSTGGVTSYGWNFGETPGINSTDVNPSYVYTAPGTYTVTLEANNAACGDTAFITNYITVNPAPVANFAPDRPGDCQPGIPFIFTDASTDAVSWSWDFGDGNGSTQQNPTHTYTANGNYTVCLAVTSASGCTDTFCQAISIQPPNVNFIRNPPDGCAPLNVQFTDISNSSDPIVSWAWNFGGGATPNTSTVQNPAATFANPGSYNVSLTITTQNGCTGSRSINGAVRVGTPPTVDFTISDDTVCLNEPVTFTSLFTNNDWDYYWDFQYEAPGNFMLMDSMPTTTYSDTGFFNVALVIDFQGCSDTLIIDSMVYVSPPRAQLVLDQPLVCSIPANVAIIDSSIGPADVYEYFIDGFSYSTQQNPPPIPVTTTGTFFITQTVLNSTTGCADTFTTVLNVGNPIADFTTDVTRACRNAPVLFDNAPSQNTVHHRWYYDFDNNSTQFSIANSAHSISYPDTGTYTVRLVGIDGLGCRDTMTKPLLLDIVGPYANFTPDVTSGCNPLTVTYSDNSATSALTTPVSWFWDLGNGTTSTQQNPSTTYTVNGLYDVSLRVTDSDGCQDSVTQNALITVTFPEPSFNVTDSSTCAGADVQFNNTSLGVGISFLWKFGDGTTSTDSNPLHAYPRDQALPYDSTDVYYDVTLIVTDINGCVDSVVIDSAVYIEPFQANFGGDPTIGICPPLNTQFTDSTIGNVVTWAWDFGDNFGQSQLQSPAYVYFLPGTFDVRLIATHEDGCQDTLIRPSYVQLAGPNGSFVVDDDSVCLGDTVRLTLITTGASLVNPVAWQDGSVDVLGGLTGINDTIVFNHVYSSTGIFSPRVVVQDVQGCQVTVPDSPIVEVFAPPIALITPDPITGCTPFTVPYMDNSTTSSPAAITSWLWDFGDGNTSTDQNPVYTFQDSGQFTVALTVIDEYGCSDTAFAIANSLEGIIANFEASDTIGCTPIEIGFTDLSTNGTPTSWRWFFGDGDSSLASNPNHTYLQDGIYTVTLIVSDALGCADTLTRVNYINLRKPSVTIEASEASGCNPIDVTFYARNLVTDTTITEYLWCLTEVNQGQTVCLPTPIDSITVPFTEPGNYIMTVVVTDALGCQGTSDTVAVDITNRSIPDPIVMRRVTVENPQTIQVDWLPYPGTDFVEYAVYRLNGPAPGLIATITDINQTTFTESNPALNAETETYCYEILVQNGCLEFSLPEDTEEHCTIDLETTSEIDAIRLDWTEYVGFQVGAYEIYRSNVYDTTALTLIGTVPGGTLTFTDFDMFCRDSVFYRILAQGFGAAYQRSYSDISGNAPTHPEPTESVDVLVATIINNEDVEISWTEYTGYLPDFYVIERSVDGMDWDSIGTAPLGVLTFTDTSANVEDQSYFYRVFAVDQCGDVTVAGLFGKTILLRSQLGPSGKVPMLTWSGYEDWPAGVLNYEIQVFNESTGEWEPVGVAGGNELGYNDGDTGLDQAIYCYRIVAFEVAASGFGQRSVSNESCVIFGPAIFAPNAFTPNNDGNNDVFRVYAPNSQSATMSIYNRWGELIYETSDLSLGWPGTRGPGEVVQEGVYVYVVRGIGFEGTEFTRSGTVTLIR